MHVYLRDDIIKIIGTVVDGLVHLSKDSSNDATSLASDCEGAMLTVLTVLEDHLPTARYEVYRSVVSEIVKNISSFAQNPEQCGVPSEVLENLKEKLEYLVVRLYNEPLIRH